MNRVIGGLAVALSEDRLLDAGDFPSRVPLGEKITGFVEHEVEAWIHARIARRAA
jgi:predicted DNA-binding transcriptional regulator AlpA